VTIGAPPAPAKRGGWIWGVVIVGAVLYGLYYIGTHNQQTPGTGGTPVQQSQTPQQGAAPQPGAPQPVSGEQPEAPQPGAVPGAAPQPAAPVQPGDSGPGGPNASLVQMQAFGGQWRVANGYVQVYNVQWMNRANVAIQSGTLECDQYDANSEVLAQNRTTLNGPVQPGATVTFNPFNMGAMQQSLKNVNCGIVAVTPAQ